MSVRNRHEERKLGILNLLARSDLVEEQKPVPRHTQWVDFVLKPSETRSEIFGPFRQTFQGRTVCGEFETKSPTQLTLIRATVVAGWQALEEQNAGDGPEARLQPLAVVFADSVSRPQLRRFQEISKPGPVEGSWWIGTRYPVETLLVDLSRLGRMPGTSILRMMPFPANDEDASERRYDLLTDPEISENTKDRLLEAMMRNEIPTEPTEEWSYSKYKQAFEAGRQERIAEGIAIGIERGRRRALLDLAAGICSAEEVQRLEKIVDIEALQLEVAAALRPKP
jgi:hypothetical protein